VFQTLPIDQIHPAEDNVRRRLGDTRDLAASIGSVGIIEPLLVTPRADDLGGGYLIVAGHRRLAAAEAAGLTDVPCTIRSLTDVERIEIGLAENIARCTLNPVDEAVGYFRMAEYGVSAKDTARRLGRSLAHVKARLALLELPTRTQAKVASGTVTIAEASTLLALKDHPDVIDRLLDGDEWDRRDLQRAVVREVSRIEGEAKATEARADLEAKGVPVIDEWDRYGSRAGEPVALGSGHGELDVKPAKHAKEPCHAAHVTRSGEVVLICTEPKRHRVGGGSKVTTAPDAPPTRTEEKAAERAGAKRRRQNDRERKAFAIDLLTRRLPKADTVALIATQFIAGAGANQAKAACALLALEPINTGYHDSHRASIVAYAAESASSRDRACLALALAAGEEAAGYDPDAKGDTARTHLDFLAAFGWNPTREEEADPPDAENTTAA
jgi:ParB/RepB/Spo0J family partition protein